MIGLGQEYQDQNFMQSVLIFFPIKNFFKMLQVGGEYNW